MQRIKLGSPHPRNNIASDKKICVVVEYMMNPTSESGDNSDAGVLAYTNALYEEDDAMDYVVPNDSVACGLWSLHFVNTINAGSKRDKEWAAVQERFKNLQVDGLLPRSCFGRCIGISKEKQDKRGTRQEISEEQDKLGTIEEEYAVQLFDALARRRGIVRWMIYKGELKQFWEQLIDRSFQARLQTFFDMVDKNGDGKITKDEIKQIISLGASTNTGQSEIKGRADECASLIMEELDPNRHGYVELCDLAGVLLQDPEEASNIASEQLKPKTLKMWMKKLNYFVVDNWKRFWVILLWLCVCVALFTWKFFQYKRRYVFHVMGYCVCVAKGGAEMTKFNMALIILPVCKNTITWLRGHSKLGLLLNFDDNISFHKVVATGIAVGIGLHVGPHMACDFPRLLNASDEAYAPLKQYFGEEKPPNYWWFMTGTEVWTGVVMVVLMVIAYILAIGYVVVRPFIRHHKKLKAPTFVKTLTQLKAFWYSHHLFVVVYALFIVHGSKLYLQHTWYKKTTWMYVAVPMVLYACERLIRSSRARYTRAVDILERRSKVLPENVLALYMTKPNGFEYTSGQYISIKCPQISHFQWHPFSLTSAPGDDYLSVHIQKAGNWTRQLLKLFSSESHHNGNGNDTPGKPKVKIDGPYAAPAQDYKKYHILLLVGSGIGVTPLISILKDVLLHQNAADLESGMTSSTASNDNGRDGGCAVKKAYLYWSARDPVCFEWFSDFMDHVAEQESTHHHHDHVIEIHNHCTGMYEEGDARSALMAMVRSLHHAKNGVDFLSRSKIPTRFGRPNWDDVFHKLANNHEGQTIGVFYCGGLRELGDQLKRLAENFSLTTTTKFVYKGEKF